MAWENYGSRYEKHRQEMKTLMEAAAAEFGVELTEENGDDKGFSFPVERGDGAVLWVELLVVDAGDMGEGPEDSQGNFIVRLGDGEYTQSWGPGNYTAECWADYDDDEAWGGKLHSVRDQIIAVPSMVEEWKAKAAPSPQS